MTEEEWHDGCNPGLLFDWLQRGKRRRLSPRKLRLFGVACCRRVWGKLSPVLRGQVEVAERHADGLETDLALKEAWWQNDLMHHPMNPHSLSRGVGWLLWGPWVSWMNFDTATRHVASLTREVGADDEYIRQADLLRDLAGNPFRPVTLDPGWLTPDAVNLARAAYDHRTLPAGTLEPARLSLLADALEDAGCDNPDLVGHLRGPGPHVRGCWAVDLILGQD